MVNTEETIGDKPDTQKIKTANKDIHPSFANGIILIEKIK